MIVTQVNEAEFGNRVAPRIDFSLLNRKIADKAVPAITQGRLEETDLKCFAQIENAEALCGVTSARITEAARRPAAQWDRQLTRRGREITQTPTFGICLKAKILACLLRITGACILIVENAHKAKAPPAGQKGTLNEPR
jgi:hypothetical protein